MSWKYGNCTCYWSKNVLDFDFTLTLETFWVKWLEDRSMTWSVLKKLYTVLLNTFTAG